MGDACLGTREADETGVQEDSLDIASVGIIILITNSPCCSKTFMLPRMGRKIPKQDFWYGILPHPEQNRTQILPTRSQCTSHATHMRLLLFYRIQTGGVPAPFVEVML